MNCLGFLKALFLTAALASGSAMAARAEAAPIALTAEEIIQKAVERAEMPFTRTNMPAYQYHKHFVVEEADKKGKVKERKDKLFQITDMAGFSRVKLLQVDGHDLPADELQKQEEKDAAEREKISGSRRTKKGERRDIVLTEEIVSRYHFTLVKPEEIDGRMNYVLVFAPKSDNLPVHKVTDKFLNQLTGKAWIDAEEFEVTKADVHLQSEVSLWGGLVGTLRRCDYSLSRKRMPEGIWFNLYSSGTFQGRKLLDNMNIKSVSEWSDFHRVAIARE